MQTQVSPTLWHLTWKDARTIKPLVLAIVAGVVALNLVYAMLISATDVFDVDRAAPAIWLWILMPNLAALGAPALLVGTEEETGTLDWLRTLPLRWQSVAAAKLLVAVASVLAVWLLASLVLWLQFLAWPSVRGSAWEGAVAPSGILAQLFFSGLLLISGFVTAYLFRSPLVALLVLVPFITLLHVVCIGVGESLVEAFRGVVEFAAPLHVGTLAASLAGAAVLAAMLIIQHQAARYRLIAPKELYTGVRSHVQPDSRAYQPPAYASTPRPSRIKSLLWQQWRQTVGVGSALGLLIALFPLATLLIENVYGARTTLAVVLMPLAAVAPILGWIWLGALVFFGDSVHRRCGFFADRGISPTAIWWTRLLYPLAILIPTTIVVPWSWAELGIGSMPNILAVGAASAVVCFAFGQLVGQWVRRPTLSFFAAPVYTAVSLAGIEFLYVLYDYLAFTIVLMAPVLFFASWRLTRRWLERRLDFGYHWRAMAYTALALALPCAAVFGHRWFTTPDARPAWRTEMAHTNVPGPNPDMPWLAMNVRSINPGLYTGDPREVHAYNEQFAELLQAELDDRNALAEHISGRDIFSFLDRINQVELGSANLSRRFRVRQGPSVPARQPPALQPQAGETRTYDREQAITMEADAIRILLKWSRQLRGRAARGQFPLSVLFEADAMEIRAVQQLEIAATRQTPETMRQLCELIPSDELRRKSRRVTLIKEWQGFQQMSWTTRTGVYVGKIFAGRGIPDSRPWLALERLRSARYVDELTHLVLNQLSGQLPLHFASPGAIHRRRLVEQAQGRAPSYSEAQRRYLERPPRPQMFDYWTADHEQRIDRLRRGYLTAGSGEPSE